MDYPDSHSVRRDAHSAGLPRQHPRENALAGTMGTRRTTECRDARQGQLESSLHL